MGCPIAVGEAICRLTALVICLQKFCYPIQHGVSTESGFELDIHQISLALQENPEWISLKTVSSTSSFGKVWINIDILNCSSRVYCCLVSFHPHIANQFPYLQHCINNLIHKPLSSIGEEMHQSLPEDKAISNFITCKIQHQLSCFNSKLQSLIGDYSKRYCKILFPSR